MLPPPLVLGVPCRAPLLSADPGGKGASGPIQSPLQFFWPPLACTVAVSSMPSVGTLCEGQTNGEQGEGLLGPVVRSSCGHPGSGYAPCAEGPASALGKACSDGKAGGPWGPWDSEGVELSTPRADNGVVFFHSMWDELRQLPGWKPDPPPAHAMLGSGSYVRESCPASSSKCLSAGCQAAHFCLQP